MAIFGYIKELDKKFAWSFSGFVLALIFGAVAIYLGFFQEKKPHLAFEVLSNTAVLDVHEQLGKLDILYDGARIKESGQTLRVITVRIINDGQADILKTYYDDNDPLGFNLTGGSVVEKPELLQASTEYLSSNIKPQLIDAHTILFSDVILETHEFYTIKILALGDEAATPDIAPFGKVAGIKTLEVTRPYQNKPGESFWARVFNGSAMVQLVRAVLYTPATLIAVIVLVISIGIPSSEISDSFRKRRRRTSIAEYKLTTDTHFTKEDDFLFQYYILHGPESFIHAEPFFSEPEKLKKAVLMLKNGGRRHQARGGDLHDVDYLIYERGIYGSHMHFISALIHSGFLHYTRHEVALDHRIRVTFKDLMQFLRNRGDITQEPREIRPSSDSETKSMLLDEPLAEDLDDLDTDESPSAHRRKDEKRQDKGQA